ncbi:hypothetical protein MAUB_58110 [Mycolicibacterium aubagnense]|uniref:Uncharacterized protein n=1 Tax=Mycolicibacterium aubagnense TaxID=319707 RepID=A0ABN5Z1R4_9MYCO|nr:hypothetical protein MAUB_58110 [Mycolicibacterium aubagnense]
MFEPMFAHWPVEMIPPTRRTIDPPQPVLVDVNQLLGSRDDCFRLDRVSLRVKMEGLACFNDALPGSLHAWAQTTRGSWLALVTCEIPTGNGKGHLTIHQWCPARLVSPTHKQSP